MKTSLAFKVATLARKYGLKVNDLKNPSVASMKDAIESLGPEGIQFAISGYEDGSWMAKSVNVDGILTGGDDMAECTELIKDAIFTYYEVPPQFCNDALLHKSGDKKTVHNEAFVTA